MSDLEGRIRPGSDPGEPVQIEEMRLCGCPYCPSAHGEHPHWFPVGNEMPLARAEKIVESHNLALARICG